MHPARPTSRTRFGFLGPLLVPQLRNRANPWTNRPSPLPHYASGRIPGQEGTGTCFSQEPECGSPSQVCLGSQTARFPDNWDPCGRAPAASPNERFRKATQTPTIHTPRSNGSRASQRHPTARFPDNREGTREHAQAPAPTNGYVMSAPRAASLAAERARTATTLRYIVSAMRAASLVAARAACSSEAPASP